MSHDVIDKVQNPNVMDFWTYGTKDGVIEKCIHNGPLGVNFYLKQQIYFYHGLDDDCENTDLSCDVTDVAPELGEITSTTDFNEFAYGFPRYRTNYLNYTTPFTEPGLYKQRYQLCSLTDVDLCSQWRDMGERKWRVESTPFSLQQVLPESALQTAPDPTRGN